MEVIVWPEPNIVLECHFAVVRYTAKHGSLIKTVINEEVEDTTHDPLDLPQQSVKVVEFAESDHLQDNAIHDQNNDTIEVPSQDVGITIVSPELTLCESGSISYINESDIMMATTKICRDTINDMIELMEQREDTTTSVSTSDNEVVHEKKTNGANELKDNNEIKNLTEQVDDFNDDVDVVPCSNDEFYSAVQEEITHKEDSREQTTLHVIVEEHTKTESEYAKLWEERKVVLEKRAEKKAKTTFQAWQRDKLSLEEIIDNSLKDYVELYERAHAMRLQFEAEKAAMVAKIHQVVNMKFVPQNQEQFQYFVENELENDVSNAMNQDGNDLKRSREEDISTASYKISKRKFMVPSKQK